MSTEGGNIEITPDELQFIRSLDDIDLEMFLSEIHDHGWPTARKLLPLIFDAVFARGMKMGARQ